MFERILIANRGEIACRVMETARAMGVETVAVYSDADAGAKHVQIADRAVHIGGSAPSESYLRGNAIIAAALETGAQAIHPGYGFLSENPEFVEAVEAAGLVFIGPSAKAIRAMGLKDAAKALMHEAGVPVVPGYHGSNQDPAYLAQQAGEIGYPVLIKAVAGGGGKGMRLVEQAEMFAQALESAQGEARTAFGNADVLIEKYITAPRHIEVQVFGDGTRALHLFERDCSLQRRHQKVIEEAPAPGMPEDVRAAMGQAAVRAAEAIGYKGAGTVEFIVDGSDGLRTDGFWFMEMNTRLQVEHPVSELITGVDLVAWQLQVAAGAPLPCTQSDLSIKGHAFEARLYAEDAAAGFLPAIGQLEHLRFDPAARNDSGVRPGDHISPFYDPMIAKIITHGPDRATALMRLRAALARTEVAGTLTNLGFLSALAAHEGFGRGEVDTGLIARDLDSLVAMPAPDDALWTLAAITALAPESAQSEGFALWTPLHWQVELHFGEDSRVIALEPAGPGHWRGTGGSVVERVPGEERWRCVSDGTHRAVRHGLDGHSVTVFAFGQSYRFERPDPLQRVSDGGANSDVVSAPMPGLVKALFATAGTAVQEGERLAVLEAMKMEHVLCAPRDGVVAEVLVAEGDQVLDGVALVALQPENEGEGGA